jgi:hypothetical protein
LTIKLINDAFNSLTHKMLHQHEIAHRLIKSFFLKQEVNLEYISSFHFYCKLSRKWISFYLLAALCSTSFSDIFSPITNWNFSSSFSWTFYSNFFALIFFIFFDNFFSFQFNSFPLLVVFFDNFSNITITLHAPRELLCLHATETTIKLN